MRTLGKIVDFFLTVTKSNGLIHTSLLFISVFVLITSFGSHVAHNIILDTKDDNLIVSQIESKDIAQKTEADLRTLQISADAQNNKVIEKSDVENIQQTELVMANDKKFTMKSGMEVSQVILKNGETFYQKLSQIGFSDSAAYIISNAVDKQFKLSKIRSNQKITFVFPKKNEALLKYDDAHAKIKEIKTLNVLIGNKLLQVDFNLQKKNYDVKVIMHNNSNDDLVYNFDTKRLSPYPEINNDGDSHHVLNSGIPSSSNIKEAALEKNVSNNNVNQRVNTKLISANGRVLVHGNIRAKSFFGSLQKAGIPTDLVSNIVAVLNNVVDFKRDLIDNSDFTVLYAPDPASKGKHKLLYIKLSTKRQQKVELYGYESKDGKIGYYGKNGENIKKAMLITPVKNPKISSTFGPRVHPTLHSVRMHYGVDYRANKGTPVMSAGDGVVQSMVYHGQYGRCLKIKHNGTYSTFYAHLHSFANGLKVGSRVKQGQIVGSVGATGRCTGPHLHYELHKNGARINPMKTKGLILTEPVMSKVQLAAFDSYKKSIESSIHQIQVAENNEVVRTEG